MSRVLTCKGCAYHKPEAKSIDDAHRECWSCKNYSRYLAPVDAAVAELFDPLKTQVGGDHYKHLKIQPIEFAVVNGLNMCEANSVKYIVRRKGDVKKRLEDLDKAIHCIQLLKQFVQEGKA